MSEKRLLILIKQYSVITTVLKVYSLVFGWFEVTLLVTERVTELVVISKPHSFEKIISNMSLIGKQVIHKNFQSESFYFFWFPGAPIVAILVSYWLENNGTNWETVTFFQVLFAWFIWLRPKLCRNAAERERELFLRDLVRFRDPR